MNSLFKYVSKYGNLSFKEEKFNDVDNVILSVLSYIKFDGIVSKGRMGITLKEAADIYFTRYSKKDLNNNIFSIKSAIKLFSFIKDYKRYQELVLYNYIYFDSSDEQFSALCIKISDDLIYVSFEGTDEVVSGWKEDLELSYMFPIPAQLDAISYLNKSIKLKDKKIIVGGHSKGGNLAVVAAMYCNFYIRNKIIKIYSNDGPGFLEEEINSRKFKRIKSRYVHLIPNCSIVGVLLNNSNDKVIKSSSKGILGHDALTWEVEDNHFVSSDLNKDSLVLKNIMIKWLDEYSFEKRMICVSELFKILKSNNIYTLLDLKKKGIMGVIKIIKDSKEIDEVAKEMFKQLLTLIYNDYSSMFKEKFSFNKNKEVEE